MIIAYAINDEQSFLCAKNELEENYKLYGNSKTIFLVGNMCDVDDRVVETSEGIKLAESYGI